MFRHITKAFLVGAGLAVVASVAMAGIPDPTMSTHDGPLMVGNARGGPIPPGPSLAPTICDGYKLIIRDIGGNLMSGVTVSLFLTGTGLRPHATQSGGQVANCVANVISAVTNAQGEVIFFPATVGGNTSAVPNVPIRANGLQMTTIRMPSIDLVPVGPGMPSSVDLVDLNEFRLRFLNRAPYSDRDPECDYATLGVSAGIVDLADLNLFRSEFLCGVAGGTPPPCSQTECP